MSGANLPLAAPGNFVTVRVPANGYTGIPCYAVVPFVPLVAEIKPKPRKLVGWKAILEVSVAHGGPSSDSALRRLCKLRNAPVRVWKGMAAIVDEDRFVWWLDGLRVFIAQEAPGQTKRGGPRRRGTGTPR